MGEMSGTNGNGMKIGEFARLSRATIRTLRYYDELDLLKPDTIDKFTGYRFYSAAKLEKMKQIQKMKEIGFTLLEIKAFLSIDETDESAKVSFITSKKRDIELENETRLNALDEFIIKLREERGNMGNKKRGPCGVFDDEDINEWWKSLKADGDMSYGKDAAKIVKIYAGNMVFGALDENGKIYVWGNNKHGQCDIPEDLPLIVELAIGAYHTAALDINGKLHGWGSNEYGVIEFINSPDDLPKMVSLKAKAYKTVALSEDGKIFSWGNSNQGAQKDVPLNMGIVTQIAAASYHSVALNSEGKAFSWGAFSENQPPAIDEGVSVLMVASTESGVACLGMDGKIYGDTRQIQLEKKFKPKPEMPEIKKIFAGNANFAAVDANGKIYVWGEYDETAGGCSVVNIPSSLPPIVDIAFEQYGISCLGKDGKIYAWGNYGSMVPSAFDGMPDGPIFEPAPIVDVNAPIDVHTFEEFSEAVQNRIKNITVKSNFTIPSSNYNAMHVNNDITLTVAEGVTLTVGSQNFNVMKKLINNGIIKGTEFGRLIVYNDISGTGSFADGFPIVFNGVKNLNEIRKYLAADSVYTETMYVSDEEPVLVIDSDLVIHKGKTLWVKGDNSVKVSEGATLTIEDSGEVSTFKKPIIEGTLVGKIKALSTEANPFEIYTYEEFYEAVFGKYGVSNGYSQYLKIKKDITVTDNLTTIFGNFEINIDDGITLTINSDFRISGKLINNGTIDGMGKLTLCSPDNGAGSISTVNGLTVNAVDVDASELGAYLSEDSIYTSVFYINPNSQNGFKSVFQVRSDGEKKVIAIDNDLTIPAGKSLWLNINCVLKVSAGVTLKIDGILTAFNEPVIDGEVIGDITIIDKCKPRDVYTYGEFYDAAQDRTSVITIKADMTITAAAFESIEVDTLIIDEGVTLTVNHFMFIKEQLINNGTIRGTKDGTVRVDSAVEGQGKVSAANGLSLSIKSDGDNSGKFSVYLAAGSIYTKVLVMAQEDKIITIASDLVIPNGKTLWLNKYYTIKVSAGVTLKIDGKLETYNEPVINGLVVGKIDVL